MLINFCHLLMKKYCLLISATLIFVNNNCFANFIETENIYSYKLLSNSYLSNRNQSNKALQNEYSKNNYDKKYAVENNSQLFLEAKKLINEQQSISLKIKLESELSSNANNFRIDIDESFLLLENNLGNLELGATKASNQKMKAGVANINNSNNFAIANGNYLKNIILPRFNSSAFVNNFNSPLFITIPQLPIAHNGEGIGAVFNEEIENGQYKTANFNKDRIKILRNTSFNGMEDANKISYYSPRISNLQLAISYTPDSSKSYFSTSVFNNKNWRVVDIATLNANYLHYLENDLSYELSASLENGRSKNNYQSNIKKRNLLAFDFGATANYFGFTLASNIGFWGNSLQNKNNNCDITNLNLNLQNQDNICSYRQNNFKPNYYALGVGYKISHFSLGISHFQSQLQKNYYSADALNFGYKINKDINLYLETINFSFKTKNIPNINLSKNKGFIALTGINLKF